MRAAPQHNEPPVARYVVVRNGHRLPEVVLVREQGCGFPKRGFGPSQVDSHGHHVLTAAMSKSALP
jgi:hypothetical protein